MPMSPALYREKFEFQGYILKLLSYYGFKQAAHEEHFDLYAEIGNSIIYIEVKLYNYIRYCMRKTDHTQYSDLGIVDIKETQIRKLEELTTSNTLDNKKKSAYYVVGVKFPNEEIILNVYTVEEMVKLFDSQRSMRTSKLLNGTKNISFLIHEIEKIRMENNVNDDSGEHRQLQTDITAERI